MEQLINPWLLKNSHRYSSTGVIGDGQQLNMEEFNQFTVSFQPNLVLIFTADSIFGNACKTDDANIIIKSECFIKLLPGNNPRLPLQP